MAEFRRDAYLTADPIELSDHLLSKGLACSTHREGDAFFIGGEFTAAALDTALSDYTPTAAPGTYRPPLPGDLPTHVEHLVSYLRASPSELAALTVAQDRHVQQDIIRALRWLLDDRLG